MHVLNQLEWMLPHCRLYHGVVDRMHVIRGPPKPSVVSFSAVISVGSAIYFALQYCFMSASMALYLIPLSRSRE